VIKSLKQHTQYAVGLASFLFRNAVSHFFLQAYTPLVSPGRAFQNLEKYLRRNIVRKIANDMNITGCHIVQFIFKKIARCYFITQVREILFKIKPPIHDQSPPK